jgi:hypothetical protein
MDRALPVRVALERKPGGCIASVSRLCGRVRVLLKFAAFFHPLDLLF